MVDIEIYGRVREWVGLEGKGSSPLGGRIFRDKLG